MEKIRLLNNYLDAVSELQDAKDEYNYTESIYYRKRATEYMSRMSGVESETLKSTYVGTPVIKELYKRLLDLDKEIKRLEFVVERHNKLLEDYLPRIDENLL
jgi:hypothetical protein